MPSNVTALSPIDLNQWPKSHHEFIIAFGSASLLILSRDSYHASFMLGISFLEDIVNNRSITGSSVILDELRKEIIWALHKKSIYQETKDGMDISLCVIDRSEMNIRYSGAFNNLYLIRKGELLEYKADRMPIGLSDFTDIRFSTQVIPYLTGDIIYMLSDGYADQFGGPDHKKFKISALKNLFMEINELPLRKQKVILEKQFKGWKKGNIQTDDVLVMGLRL